VSDRATVAVHVTDRNDNRPTIVFPVCNDADRRDCEYDVITPSVGDVITRVIAVDADDVSGSLRYELVGGEAANRLLGINSTSGQVTVTANSYMPRTRREKYILGNYYVNWENFRANIM